MYEVPLALSLLETVAVKPFTLSEGTCTERELVTLANIAFAAHPGTVDDTHPALP